MPDAPGTLNFPTSLDTVTTLIQVTNNASTTLNGGVNSSATTLTVASTTSFPSSGALSIEGEVVFYTGTTSTTFTGCTRGQDGTSAASHSTGALVQGLIVAAHHKTLVSGVLAVEAKLGSGVSTPVSDTVLKGTGSGTSAWGTLSNATGSTAGLMSASDKTKLDGATSSPTASTLMMRDSNGRAQVAAPSATDDIATKGYVDASPGAVTAYKTADQSVTNSTTLVNDTQLKFTMASNGIYRFEFEIFFSAADANPDIKLALNGPSGLVNLRAQLVAYNNSANGINTGAIITAYEAATASTYGSAPNTVAYFIGTVENGATAGDLVLRFAQNTSNATAITIKRGSSLIAHKLN